MTVIAWDGETLCCDGRITIEGNITSDKYNKIFPLKEVDYLGDSLMAIGMAGSVSEWDKILGYLLNNLFPFTDETISHDVGAIIIGEKYCYELEMNQGWFIRHNRKQFLASGSGMMYALSAMSLGLNSKAAVQHAIKHDVYCGGKIRCLSL